MFYTCVCSCNYCSVLSRSTCVWYSTGIPILCDSTKGMIGRKRGHCRLSVFNRPFSLCIFPREYEVLTLNVFSVCVCLWWHAVDQAPQLFHYSLYQLLFVSLILPELREDIVLLTGVFHPAPRERGRANVTRCIQYSTAFYRNVSETVEVRCRVGLHVQIQERIRTKFFCTESSMTTVAGKRFGQPENLQ